MSFQIERDRRVLPGGDWTPYQMVKFLETGRIPQEEQPSNPSSFSYKPEPKRPERPIIVPPMGKNSEPNFLGRIYRKIVRADTSEKAPKKTG